MIAIALGMIILIGISIYFIFASPEAIPTKGQLKIFHAADSVVLPDDFGEPKSRILCHINEENDAVSLVATSTGGYIQCPVNCEVIQDMCVYPLSDEQIIRELRKGPQGLTHGEEMFVMRLVNSDPKIKQIIGERSYFTNCCSYMSELGPLPRNYTLGVIFNMTDKVEVVSLAFDLQSLKVEKIIVDESPWIGSPGIPTDPQLKQHIPDTTQVVPRGDLFSQQPLRIIGLNETQYVGQEIEFTVQFNGTKAGCYSYPTLWIENSNHQKVWESNFIVELCDPELTPKHIEQDWKIGNVPLGTPIVNKPGFYQMFAEFENDITQNDFWVNPQISTIIISNKTLGQTENNLVPQIIKVKINLNNTVRWENHDNSPINIQADNASYFNFFDLTNFDINESSFLLPGKPFEFTFDKEGTFGYHGKPWQRGTIIVLPPDEGMVQLQIQQPDSFDDMEYSLKVAARKGFLVSWYNIDNKTHTITSKNDNGKSFDSRQIPPRATFTLDTSTLKTGYYQYFDKLNPDLSDTIRIIDPGEFDDNKIIQGTKSLDEVQAFLKKYPKAFSYVDHDFFDMVTFGMIKNDEKYSRFLRLQILLDESGSPNNIFVTCGYGGIGMETTNAFEYLKTEKCLQPES